MYEEHLPEAIPLYDVPIKQGSSVVKRDGDINEVYYVSKIELLSIVTVFLAYVGIGIGKSWDDFKALGLKAVIVTMLVIASTYLGSAVVAHVILLLTGVPA